LRATELIAELPVVEDLAGQKEADAETSDVAHLRHEQIKHDDRDPEDAESPSEHEVW